MPQYALSRDRVRSSVGTVVTASALAMTACGSNAQREATPPRSAPAELRTASAFASTGWEVVRVPEVALELNLPLASGWRALPGSAWTRLEHAASASLLEVR